MWQVWEHCMCQVIVKVIESQTLCFHWVRAKLWSYGLFPGMYTGKHSRTKKKCCNLFLYFLCLVTMKRFFMSIEEEWYLFQHILNITCEYCIKTNFNNMLSNLIKTNSAGCITSHLLLFFACLRSSSLGAASPSFLSSVLYLHWFKMHFNHLLIYSNVMK